jgi:hypothetical protein
MKFIEVNYNDLKLETKYLIVNHFKTNDKIYVGTFNGFCNKYTIGEISHWGKTYVSYLTNYNKKYLVGELSLNIHLHLFSFETPIIYPNHSNYDITDIMGSVHCFQTLLS